MITEKLCSKCGKPGRFRKNKRRKDGLRSECADCQDAYGKTYAVSHRDHIGEYRRKWCDTNREHRRAKGREQWHRHRDKYMANERARRASQPEKGIEYRRKNAERERARVLKWQKDKPHMVAAKAARRHARERGCAPVEISLTHQEWVDVLEYFGHRCAYCLVLLSVPERDHVTAVSRGGSHTQDNIVPACRSCNSSKGAAGPLRMVSRMFPAKEAQCA